MVQPTAKIGIGSVEVHRAVGARGRRAHRDERADLEPTLTGVAVDREIVVVEQRVAIVATPTIEEVTVPGLVDLPRIGRGGPVRDATGPDDGDALGYRVGGPPQRLAERPRPGEAGSAADPGS